MRTRNIFTLSASPPAPTARNSPDTAFRKYGRRSLNRHIRRGLTVKEPDSETGLYYYGARYLDPKTSRWLSGDPALGEYLPSAPVNDEARKRNQSLPGQGGVFNYVNLHAYHYAGNNPVKYVDPDGENLTLKQVLGLAREFAEIFSIDIKFGIGFDVSVISSVKIDLFSQQATFSFKDGYKEKCTTGISAWIIGGTRTAPDVRNLSGIEALKWFGENEINIGPVVFNEKTGVDVVLSFGAQALVGFTLNISGKEALEFLAKIGELQDALRQ